ncbi:MAG TPA: relaxase/mobilization nuclease domain-containing protein [Puia sp.]|nr:relaxase/mobilization nuclease domain-containing protein [Puia sp.]
MVAKITSPHSIKRALNYNEQKVKQRKAECIYAGNYLKDLGKLNFYQKLNRFENLIVLNERAKKSNTLHISLNFYPSERLDREKLISIAKSYMEKIGFGDQPYLAYEHHDAGHPHIHIVTTNIEAGGKRINTYNIGRNQSETARKEIERDFGLMKASSKNKSHEEDIENVTAQRAQYGKSETKRAITNVLDAVIDKYKYTSLAELNAILKQYNVMADKGIEGGRIQRHNGLRYTILDAQGKKAGVPIKASSIYSKPTLTYLEKKFEENQIKRQPDKQKLRTAIDWCLSKKVRSLEAFIEQLKKEKVQVVLRQNGNGQVYGITFIDYRTKSVFSGSDIGKAYSIGGIKERLGIASKYNGHVQDEKISAGQHGSNNIKQQKEERQEKSEDNPKHKSFPKDDLLQLLLKPERNEARVPFQLLQKKKKKKRSLGL